MRSEIDALVQNDTWHLSTLPPGKKVFGCKWVYKIKHKSDGCIVRYKARAVIFINTQVEGLGYNETFALAEKMLTVRALLLVAAARN